MKATPVRELLKRAREWADGHDPMNEEIRQALFEGHLAYLINEMLKEAYREGKARQ